MNIRSPQRVCVLPRVSGVGGMVSFQRKFAQGLEKRGVEVCFDLKDTPYRSILVIGGTRQVLGLWRARRKGIPVVQRLDGMNWIHRLSRGSLRHYLKAEYGNAILGLIRCRLASQLVYQSHFVRCWWERVHGVAMAPQRVIYNGVDLKAYSPWGAHQRPLDRFRILMVEGSLAGGYEQGLGVGVQLAAQLSKILPEASDEFTDIESVELMVIGQVTTALREHWEWYLAANGLQSRVSISWVGVVPGERIPEYDRSAHLFYAADINSACPNSVIEALACGLPVLSFDTGALPELVVGAAGRVVPYGGDPWKLEPPNVGALVQAAMDILRRQEYYRQAARRRAEQAFDLEQMMDAYLEVLM